MATMVIKIRKNFEIFINKTRWGSNIEEVLGTPSFIFTHINENLVRKVLIEYISVH
jgi:hypothetical protein